MLIDPFYLCAFVHCGKATSTILTGAFFIADPPSLHLTRHLLVALPPWFDSVSIIVVFHIAISNLDGTLVLLPFLHLVYEFISSCAISYRVAGPFYQLLYHHLLDLAGI